MNRATIALASLVLVHRVMIPIRQIRTALCLLMASVSPVVLAGPPTQSPAAMPVIIDRPIRYDAARVKLTLDYRHVHQDPAIRDTSITPRMIVLHYTGGNSFQATWGYFNHLEAEASRKGMVRAGAVNVSAHYIVDQDGTIYRLLPETTMARHAIGLNHIAIGVENVGDGKRYPLTDAQVAANAALSGTLRLDIAYSTHRDRSFQLIVTA